MTIDFDKLSRLSEEERWRRREPLFEKDFVKDCKAPFHSATVYADGSVIPCCTFQGKNLTLGNINGIPELQQSDYKEITVRGEFIITKDNFLKIKKDNKDIN